MAALAPSKTLGTQLNLAGSSRCYATAAARTTGAQKIVSLFSKKPAPQKAKPATVSSSGPDISDELAKWYGPDRRIFLPEGLLDRSEVPEYLNGEVPGDYGYDPFGLGKKPEDFAKWVISYSVPGLRADPCQMGHARRRRRRHPGGVQQVRRQLRSRGSLVQDRRPAPGRQHAELLRQQHPDQPGGGGDRGGDPCRRRGVLPDHERAGAGGQAAPGRAVRPAGPGQRPRPGGAAQGEGDQERPARHVLHARLLHPGLRHRRGPRREPRQAPQRPLRQQPAHRHLRRRREGAQPVRRELLGWPCRVMSLAWCKRAMHRNIPCAAVAGRM